MKVLWAPWRMDYILSGKPEGCIFCNNPAAGDDRKNLILFRAKSTFVMMNLYPYNNGHVMVAPYVHRPSFDGLTDEAVCEMMLTTRKAVQCIREAFKPEGFNIGLNLGKVAGAGIEEHLHIHIVPRWAGDTSFMTIQGEVRVIPEHILDTYDKLYPVFNRK